MQYWPKRGTQGSYGNLRVTTKSEEEVNDAMCCRKFEITRYVPGGSVRPTAYYILACVFQGIEFVHAIWLLYRPWWIGL